ncbi:glutamate--tRNA ligase [Nocardioides sp. Kera G14]|uniref:glutamate--tRNA ligase n=1 Tax=Nocardioides sp. Kera G14 TaxID=2884264 RepID=UPI001D11323A|nr:glutamate--tRNA ligase [Nocardioides sp. Kera G14]UDY22699.1 glutamate--tRNA ligase [Nocardioides sp. Kera G14]
MVSTVPTGSAVRVRMAPSPTGSPHVGMIRTALFNWAFARHHGGTFVFRIEDTDLERNTQESLDSIIELLRWCGLNWDEGPEVGGDYGPYFQSQRSDIYADTLAKLLDGGHAYRCYCTATEVDARFKERQAAYKAAKAAGETAIPPVMGYDGFCRSLTDEQLKAFEGRPSVPRLRMPEGTIGWNDLVRGEISFATKDVPDYALTRANGDPLYTLTNPTDDALMKITHVLRGEDLLSSTPRQLALYEAFKAIGLTDFTPEFGHLPYVMGEGNKKLSKRDPEAHALAYRDNGYIPEGLLNYLSLLGWSIAADRDIFSMEEMVEKFDIKDVNPNPARFDLKKCDAINTSQMRLLSVEEITSRALPFLKRDGVLSDPVTPSEQQLLELAMPFVAERVNKLTEVGDMLGFLFVADADFALDVDDRAKLVDTDEGQAVVQAASDALMRLQIWSAAEINDALQNALVEEMGLKPRVAFGPVRVAVTGRRISPPLFESLELLGRERSLARLQAALS